MSPGDLSFETRADELLFVQEGVVNCCKLSNSLELLPALRFREVSSDTLLAMLRRRRPGDMSANSTCVVGRQAQTVATGWMVNQGQ